MTSGSVVGDPETIHLVVFSWKWLAAPQTASRENGKICVGWHRLTGQPPHEVRDVPVNSDVIAAFETLRAGRKNSERPCVSY